MNYGFIIDNRKCIGCHACTVACKAEHDVPLGVNRTWVKYIEKGEYPDTRRLFSVMRCNHCADAPCVEICPVTALYTRDDGIVDFDPRRCIGCKGCMQACPYDALYIDPASHTAAKCNYCAHRIDIGLEPACVNVCPEHAIISGDMDNPQTEIAQLLAREQVTARKVEKGTRPKLFYIEGDDASLSPTATPQAGDYMWSSQSTGVGHFAKYAEARITNATSTQMAQPLAASGTWVGDAQTSNVLLALGGGGTEVKKARDVVQEKTRRVYDAPGKGVLWGWEVSAYVWTKAIATGAFLIPFLAMAFGWAPVQAGTQWTSLGLGLVFLMLTAFLLIKDLDQPRRFAYVLLRPQWRSWLVLGGYALTMYGAMLTLWGMAVYLGWTSVATVAWWITALLAVISAVYTAFLFAQAKGRDFWQSPALSLHMLVHAVMAGAAVFATVDLLTENGTIWREFLGHVLYVSLAFSLLVLIVELVTAHPTADATRVVRMIVAGPFSLLFWLGTVLIGHIVPLWFVWLGAPVPLAVAGMCVLAGVYITEHIWVRAPQLIPLS